MGLGASGCRAEACGCSGAHGAGTKEVVYATDTYPGPYPELADSAKGVHSSIPEEDREAEREATLHVDDASRHLLRAIPLAAALRRPWLWRTSPVDLDAGACERLWNLSMEVASFDIFLSHTWQTSGLRKYLSLLLQSGWQVALLAWAAAVLTTLVLGVGGLLPLPLLYNLQHFDLDAEVHFGPWIYACGNVAAILGLSFSPLFACRRQPKCFLDVVSINQAAVQQTEPLIF